MDDVRTLDNDFACSASVRSEIVVLIRVGGRILGRIDLDADTVGAFDEEGQRVLRAAAEAFGSLVELA